MATLDCHERALGLLAVRPRSRRELERRLLRAGFDPDEIVNELARLEAVGLVDDEAFARQVVEHELSIRRSGRRAIVSRLIAKGVPRDTIDLALEESGPDADEERALELARARATRLAGLPTQQAVSRLVAFLGRRGHDPELSRRVARQALGLDRS